MKKKNLILISLLLFIQVAFSQDEAAFSFEVENLPVSETLSRLEDLFDVKFSYADDILKGKEIHLTMKYRTLLEAIEEISVQESLFFEAIDGRYFIVRNAQSSSKIQVLEGVLLTGYLAKGIFKNSKGSFVIKPHQLEILPGLTETDILESIQLLPGVVSPNETASGILVRGGEADQNRVIWNDINIYHKGHLFGMISPFNPNTTKEVTFINKGTNPRYGERISSVIDLSSGNKIIDILKAGIGVNGINGDVYLEVPVVENRLSVEAAFRRSYTELIQTTTFDRLADKTFQNTKIENTNGENNTFFFVDYNAKINYKLNANNTISFSAIYIDNQLDYSIFDTEESLRFTDLMSIKNEGFGATWETIWNNKVSMKTSAFSSKYRFNYNYITDKENERVSDFNKKNIIFDSGISSEINVNISNKSKVDFGYQYTLKDVSYAFLETSELSFLLDNDKTVVNTHSVYSNYNLSYNFFNLSVGARINYYKELNKTKFEPRVLMYKNLFRNIKLQASWELKNQIISEIDETILSDLSLENKLWRLANGKEFPVIHGNQVSLGLLYSHLGWSFDIDGYYKTVDGMTALALGFLNPEDSTFHIGDEEVFGIDFYLKKDFGALKTWIGYSYNDVKSKFRGINSDAYFTSNTNIKHSLTTSVALKLQKFQVALAWYWRTGRPYTEALIDTDGAIYFDEINGKILPNYHRLDLSSTYGFNLSRSNRLKGKIGFSIRNIYNKRNHLSKEYVGNNNLNDPTEVHDRFSLGFTPNFLLRIYW
tara:strand:- start:1534 stop:3837 length:2304 start_codon:yes stop_codon:yes gene_type:complete